jgi:hypothetical protein
MRAAFGLGFGLPDVKILRRASCQDCLLIRQRDAVELTEHGLDGFPVHGLNLLTADFSVS